MIDISIDPASYKDPAGFVFQCDGIFYRRVNASYAPHFDLLMESGLYAFLTNKGWLLPHTVTEEVTNKPPDLHKILLPQQLSFISYVYEWSFDMLKDAALLTLNINIAAIDFGMILKDATPYNIQFCKGKPVFIDTLSFEKYDRSKPWVAYRQFCEMFLFPLYLEKYLTIDIKKMLSIYIDGIPAAVAARLLPLKSRMNMSVWLHVHLQNAVKQNNKDVVQETRFDDTKLKRLLQHLKGIIQKLTPGRLAFSSWSSYYEVSIISKEYLQSKENIFCSLITDIDYETVLDIGANDGYFTWIIAEKAKEVIAVDSDSHCLNGLYMELKKEKCTNVLPLVIDISNPSPAIGFNNTERQAFLQRAKSDLVIVLALTHHLVFTKNITLNLLAGLLKQLTKAWLVVEFVPMDDQKVQHLIQNKTSYHLPYDEETFEKTFMPYFEIKRKELISGSRRLLYLMKKLY